MYIGVHFYGSNGNLPAFSDPRIPVDMKRPGFRSRCQRADEKTECFLWFLPRLISLTVMAEENPQPQNTGEQPSQAPPQQQTGQQPRTPQGQGSGQRRNDRRDHSRIMAGGGTTTGATSNSPPGQQRRKNPRNQREKTRIMTMRKRPSSDRSSPQGRHHHRGGRPPKRVIEEWVKRPVLRVGIR